MPIHLETTDRVATVTIDRTHHDNHAEVAHYEAAFASAWASDDLAEGRRAFAERRSPAFLGR